MKGFALIAFLCFGSAQATCPAPLETLQDLFSKEHSSIYYRKNLGVKTEVILNDVLLSSERAKNRVIETIQPDAFHFQDELAVLHSGWETKLTRVQKRTLDEYNNLSRGGVSKLKFLNRETALMKEMADHVLPKNAIFKSSESELSLDLSNVNLAGLSKSQLKLTYQFQETLLAVEKNPLDYKWLLDNFTGRLEISKASLGQRAGLIPDHYDEFLRLHNYKDPLTSEPNANWKKIDLDGSQFSLVGGTRRVYRGQDGISILENVNAEGKVETVEVMVQRDLKTPAQGVGFFSYDLEHPEKPGALSEFTRITFRGKSNISRTTTTNGCISCHKMMGNEFSTTTSTFHPFTARAQTHPVMNENVHPISQTLKDAQDLSIAKLREIKSELNSAVEAHRRANVTLNSGIEITGPIANPKWSAPGNSGKPVYLHFDGATELSCNGKVLAGQGVEQHAHGFGSPVGKLEGNIDLSRLTDAELKKRGWTDGKVVTLKYESGVEVNGMLVSKLRDRKGIQILTFHDCTVTLGDQVLFEPSWGVFDMAVGANISQVK